VSEPLIIPAIEWQAHIRSIAPDVQFPSMLRAPYVMVPNVEWFDDVWNPQWWAYCKARDFTYIPGSGMCEQFSRCAVAELNFDCIETVRAFDASRRDVHVAAAEMLCVIPPGFSLNNVRDGGHSTCLVTLTPDGKNYETHAWEPQNRIRTPLAEAIAGGLVLRDVV
jgi:hypothetical protein